jgi:hypothetical protein
MSEPTFKLMLENMTASQLEYAATRMCVEGDAHAQDPGVVPGWLYMMLAKAYRYGSKTCRKRVMRTLKRHGWTSARELQRDVSCLSCNGTTKDPVNPAHACWHCGGTGVSTKLTLVGVEPNDEMLKLGA